MISLRWIESKVTALVLIGAVTALAVVIIRPFGLGQDSTLQIVESMAEEPTGQELNVEFDLAKVAYFANKSPNTRSRWIKATSDMTLAARRGELDPNTVGLRFRNILLELEGIIGLSDVDHDRYLRIWEFFQECKISHKDGCWDQPPDPN